MSCFEEKIFGEKVDKVCGNIAENFLQTVSQEPLVGVLLNFDQIGHIQNFFDMGETLAYVLSQLNLFDIHHRLTHSILYF